MRRSKLIYLNPICYMDTDLSVLKYLNAHYELIWYPIYYTKETKYSIQEIEDYAKSNQIECRLQLLNCRQRSFYNFKSLLSILINIRKEKPDILFTSNRILYWHILCRLFIGKRKIVQGIHDVIHHSNISLRKFMVLFSNIVYNLYSNYILYSKSQLELLKTMTKGNCHFVGMSTKDFGKSKKQYSSITEGVKILFFGGISKYKGVDLLIEKVEELYNEGVNNISISICGKGGEYWNGCKKLIKTRSIYNLDIRLIPNELVADLMSSHHFLILPYRDVTNSGPMMIALNYSLPIIAPKIGCFVDVLNEDSAILYEQGMLKQALLNVSKLTPEEYDNLRQSVKQCSERYSEPNIASNYIYCFDRIINNNEY